MYRPPTILLCSRYAVKDVPSNVQCTHTLGPPKTIHRDEHTSHTALTVNLLRCIVFHCSISQPNVGHVRSFGAGFGEIVHTLRYCLGLEEYGKLDPGHASGNICLLNVKFLKFPQIYAISLSDFQNIKHSIRLSFIIVIVFDRSLLEFCIRPLMIAIIGSWE